MVKIQHIPLHILDIILQDLPKKTLFQCRTVCLKWNSVVTKYLFREVRISGDIKAFFDVWEAKGTSGRIDPRECIKELSLEYINHLSFEEFKQLVICCPNVKMLLVFPRLYETCVSNYLLEIDDDIKWKLEEIFADLPYQPTLYHYLKYKDSITNMSVPKHVTDLQFLQSFPSLQELTLPPRLAISSVQDFAFIFDTCSNIDTLDVTIEIDDVSHPVLNQDPYPSLTSLTIASFHSTIPNSLIHYISTRFVNLFTFYVYFVYPRNIISLGETYSRLLDGRIAHPKYNFVFHFDVNDGAGRNFTGTQREIAHMVTECLSATFKHRSVLPKVRNSLRISKQSFTANRMLLTTSLTNHGDKQMHCLVQSGLEFSDIINQPVLSARNLSQNLHQLAIEGEDSNIGLSENDYSSIEKCPLIYELTFFRVRLQPFENHVYRSVKILNISSAQVHVDFFQTLGARCPHLEDVTLSGICVIGPNSTNSHVVIDFQDIKLRRLNLYSLKNGAFMNAPCLLTIKTLRKHLHIKVEGWKALEKITEEEAVECHAQNYSRYYIYCNDIQELTIHGKLVLLYSDDIEEQ
ncbi:hypothetical protein RMCBS344292_11161 [Rhizopus microsporus]|nr:hypothetical protein RMCBS344292_11161 [Rhizopus microsporus]